MSSHHHSQYYHQQYLPDSRYGCNMSADVLLQQQQQQQHQFDASSIVVATNSKDDEPREDDVLCGRDKAAFEWKGNKEFRERIWKTLPKYAEADSRLKKSKVVKALVEEFYDEGRRFLKKSKEGLWLEIGKDKARDKTAHAFRDATSADRRRIHPKGYRRASKSKKSKRQAASASVETSSSSNVKTGPVSPRSIVSLSEAASHGDFPIKTPTLYDQEHQQQQQRLAATAAQHCHDCGHPTSSTLSPMGGYGGAGSVVYLDNNNNNNMNSPTTPSSQLLDDNFTIADFEEQNLWFDERMNKQGQGNMTWSDALDAFNDMTMEREREAEEQQQQQLQQQQQQLQQSYYGTGCLPQQQSQYNACQPQQQQQQPHFLPGSFEQHMATLKARNAAASAHYQQYQNRRAAAAASRDQTTIVSI